MRVEPCSVRLGFGLAAMAGVLALAGCASHPSGGTKTISPGPSSYRVNGHTYHVLASAAGFDQTGIASWYGHKFQGRPTASGQIYNMYHMTAAHKRLPLGTRVRVTNLENGRRAIVTINDRGPFHRGRVIDLSYAAAKRLGIIRNGHARVRVAAVAGGAPTASATVATGTATSNTSSKAQSAAGGYLQVGAFGQPGNARRLVSRLRGAGIRRVRVLRARPRGNLYRVQIGPFAGPTRRARTRRKLDSMGINAIAIND